MLRGDVDDLPEPLAAVSTAGALRGHGADFIDRWIDAAAEAGLIAVSADTYRTLSLTAPGRDVLTGRVGDPAIVPPVGRPAGLSRRRLREEFERQLDREMEMKEEPWLWRRDRRRRWS